MFLYFVALLLFADDLCLLAPSRAALQRMINKCAEYCNKFGLSFNAKKSKILIFSKKAQDKENHKPIYLNGDKVDYVDSVTYLGTTIVSEKGLSFSSSKDLLSFYRASNAILRATNRPSEDVLLHLLYSNCIPILTYACAVKDYPARQMQDCNTAVNDALRLIFGYNRWESVRQLRESFGYKSLTELFALHKKKFGNSLLNNRNSVISHIARNITFEE